MTIMKSAIERYRELAGIVESRPAYLNTLGEETQEMLEARIGNLTETELQSEIDNLIAERQGIELQLQAAGLLEHYLKKSVTANQSPEAHAADAKKAGQEAKAHTLHKKLAGLKQPKKPHTPWMVTHHDDAETGNLQHGDKHTKEVTDPGRQDRQRRMHARAAFHHYHAGQGYAALGNKNRAKFHAKAAEAHHVRATAPKEPEHDATQSKRPAHNPLTSYMLAPHDKKYGDEVIKAGKYAPHSPVYDKKAKKTSKNVVSKAARTAAAKAAKDAENPDTRAATADKERAPWKAHGTDTEAA